MNQTRPAFNGNAMAIRFVCCCGQHLRARDAMAGRRTMCPACGAPVGVPAAGPTHRGIRSASTPASGRLARRPGSAPIPRPGRPQLSDNCRAKPGGRKGRATEGGPCNRARQRPTEADGVRLVVARERRPASWRRQRTWQLETRWYQSLLYPLRALPVLLCLAVVLALSTGTLLLLLPRVLQLDRGFWVLGTFVFLCAVLPLLLVGYCSSFLSQVLAEAAAGGLKHVGWPGLDPRPVLASLVTWFACFLAGPVLPAGLSLSYWVHGGVLGPLDRLILAELLVPATGYWFIALLAVTRGDGLRDASPPRVIETMRHLGKHALAAVALGSSLGIAHGLMAAAAVSSLHRNPAIGFLMLGLCWTSGLYLGTFAFRLLGLWYYRSLRQQPRDTLPLWAIPGATFPQPS